MKKDYKNFIYKDFFDLPEKSFSKIDCEAVVVIDCDTLHESGHRLLSFCFIQGGNAVFRTPFVFDIFYLQEKNIRVDCLEGGAFRVYQRGANLNCTPSGSCLFIS